MYDVRFIKSAEKDMAGLPRKIADKIAKKAAALGDDPRPPGCLKLKGFDDLWRIRVGDYRVIYSIKDQVLSILVVKVAHRREAYD